MTHSFDVMMAREVGLVPAILFNAIGFWVSTNKANNRNLIDGRYWTFNSVKAWADLFPYISQKQVEKGLAKLRETGYVLAENHNDDKRVRTLWYTLSDKGWLAYRGSPFPPQGKSISPTGEVHFPHRGNDYITNTVNTTVNTPIHSVEDAPKGDDFKDEIEEVVAYLNERTGKSYRTKTEDTRSRIRARLKDGYTVEDFRRVIDNKSSQWLGTDWEKFLRPSTLFSPSHFDAYLNEAPANTLNGYDLDAYELEEWTSS